MMILDVDEMIVLHSRMVGKTGGSDGLRDRGLLESAVYSAQSSFGGEEVYPTVEEKAARLMYALVSNHAFVDGNKRIGILAALVTLRLNEIELEFSQQELIELGLSAASGTESYESILAWICEHRKK